MFVKLCLRRVAFLSNLALKVDPFKAKNGRKRYAGAICKNPMEKLALENNPYDRLS